MPPIARTPTCHPERKHSARGLCHPCYEAAWRAAHPDRPRKKYRYPFVKTAARAKARRRWQLARYGVTEEQYRDMVVGQAGRCLICHRVPDKDLAVDHNHETGQVRGLLCSSCNLAIGHLRDKASLARRAAAYLGAWA